MINSLKIPDKNIIPERIDTVSVTIPLSNSKSGLFTMESWEDIKGHEGCYQISTLGRVKSLSRYKENGKFSHWTKEIIKKQTLSNSGYCQILLFKQGAYVNKSVHRLVAMAFIPNPENKLTVNHKNGIKKDNRIENLEWCTYSENQFHAYKIGLKTHSEYQKMQTSLANRGSKQHLAKLKEIDILKIRKLNETIKSVEIAKIYNVTKATISYILSGKTWRHV